MAILGANRATAGVSINGGMRCCVRVRVRVDVPPVTDGEALSERLAGCAVALRRSAI